MPLQSKLFRDDQKLQACLLHDASHVTVGAVGDHVGRIQTALMQIDGLPIDSHEILDKRYGSSTASAVLRYKTKRKIINRSYQTQADNIVGKMTIASLDEEMLRREKLTTIVVETITCRIGRKSDVPA
ncbi:MAG: hypothetical protein ACR2I2_06465 [Bryobacteraceae bacterium]